MTHHFIFCLPKGIYFGNLRFYFSLFIRYWLVCAAEKKLYWYKIVRPLLSNSDRIKPQDGIPIFCFLHWLTLFKEKLKYVFPIMGELIIGDILIRENCMGKHPALHLWFIWMGKGLDMWRKQKIQEIHFSYTFCWK